MKCIIEPKLINLVEYNKLDNGVYKLLCYNHYFSDTTIYLSDLNKNVLLGYIDHDYRRFIHGIDYVHSRIYRLLMNNNIGSEEILTNENNTYYMFNIDAIFEKNNLGYRLYIVINGEEITLINKKYALNLDLNKCYHIDKLYLMEYPFFTTDGKKYKLLNEIKEFLIKLFRKYINFNHDKNSESCDNFYCIYKNKKAKCHLFIETFSDKGNITKYRIKFKISRKDYYYDKDLPELIKNKLLTPY